MDIGIVISVQSQLQTLIGNFAIESAQTFEIANIYR